MKRYNPSEIEPKWQKIWSDTKAYEVEADPKKRKTYVAGMFPYPSGVGLHTGHARNYSIVDAIARFNRQLGHNVLNPIGWDAFGLPTEDYAIKTGRAPADITKENVGNFKKQLTRLGMSFDWSREINTSSPEYYRWTQWVFLQLFKRGLAYQKESYQWWDPIDKTVLANEQVVNGRSERSGAVVEKRKMKQWFFRITAYADQLLDGLDEIDWPERIKTAQRNWIGRSEGALIKFKVEKTGRTIEVFSTRPDTLFGATYLALAPEHELVEELINDDTEDEVRDYVRESIAKTEIERMESKDKTGVFTGSYAINPVNGNKIPIWVADYVLTGYGTGAIMAVPAHDQRDYDFAKKFDIPVIQVVEKPEDEADTELYTGEGTLTNSGAFDGTRTEDAREQIVAWLEERDLGQTKVTYKMRDWLISRQRYWGAPIPIAFDKDGKPHAIPEDQLPVLLPQVEDYKPDGSGKGVLARSPEFMKVTINGEEMTRETDTMDGYACSSWYLLRYADPHNDKQAWDSNKVNYWAPLDYYCGGDHATAHLLYVRFWTRVFYDMGLIDFQEPVKKLVYNGYINAADGTKMSKSKGNTVDPLELVSQGYGADALRVYELFIGPYELDASWDPRGIAGTYRFINRVWVLVQEYLESAKQNNVESDSEVEKLQNRTIKKVTDDLTRLSFNTAISSLMEYVNGLYKLKTNGFDAKTWPNALGDLVLMLAPFAPHVAAELWQQMGYDNSVESAGWPNWDEALTKDDTVTVVVQINGKLRGQFEAEHGIDQTEADKQARTLPNVAERLNGKTVRKVIYVKGKLLNYVVTE